VLVIPDRRDAIRTAVSFAKAGDVVVVAGRGNDGMMNYDGMEIRFDDRQVLERALTESAK
jgi:UDP-N-acetylmuramoyl-L-alanyl-D-glutamate--2,6-diaminopimelate ligase